MISRKMRLTIHLRKGHLPSECRRMIRTLGTATTVRRIRSGVIPSISPFMKVDACSLTASTSIASGRPKSAVANPEPPVDHVPTSSPLTAEEVSQVVTLLENDPRILLEVITQLDPENRRRLVVAGGAMEWFGAGSAAQEIERADIDKDRQISPKDFDHWFQNALKRKMEQHKRKVATTEGGPVVSNLSSSSLNSSAGAGLPPPSRQDLPLSASSSGKESASNTASNTILHPSSIATSSTGSIGEKESKKCASFGSHNSANVAASSVPPFRTLIFVAMEAALPFVGFGFLDNAAMILAGDAIDNTLGFYLNSSVLASAAMGNVCSGLLGMQVHGLIEKGVHRVFPFAPVLTIEMMRHPRVFFAGHIGGTVGILIGLLLGMLPLLFLDTSSSDVEKSDYAIFQKMDVNNDGFVELTELVACLEELGVERAREMAQDLLTKFGDGNRITFDEFGKFRSELRDAKKNVLLVP